MVYKPIFKLIFKAKIAKDKENSVRACHDIPNVTLISVVGAEHTCKSIFPALKGKIVFGLNHDIHKGIRTQQSILKIGPVFNKRTLDVEVFKYST